MDPREFENFLLANNWIRVDHNNFYDDELSLTISGNQVNIYRKGRNKCIFSFVMKDAQVTSESTLTVKKDGKEYKVPFKKGGL